MTHRRAQLALLGAGVSCSLLLSACGSLVAPQQFVEPRGGFGGSGATAAGGPAGQAAALAGSAASGAARAPGALAGPAGSTGTGGSGPGQVGGSGGSGGAASSAPRGGVQAGSCAGFTNGPGITDSTITVVNASDVSGPIPGLFTSAQQATQAYVAYFDATSSICGRKLREVNLDSTTSSPGDQQAATTACSEAFAMVGSMSAYDDGGAQTVAQCGIPDLRAITVNPARTKSAVSFGTDSVSVPQIPAAPFEYYKSVGGDAYQHAAMLYLNAGAVIPNEASFQKAEESLGFKFVYPASLDVATFNYAPYVARMKDAGVKYVQWAGAYQYAVRLKQAMAQQGFSPMFVMDSVAYDPAFVSSGGGAVDGTYAFVDTDLFEEQSRSPEMQLYLQWLHRVAPSATPSFFGIFAWGAAKLFVQHALELGGRLNRQTLLAAIRATSGYSANGLFAPQSVGAKQTSPCASVIQLVGGHWVRKTPYPYTCGAIIDTGVGS
jgi:ABC-type branched-subunit amino acid transport system substrate-binding protein